MTMPDAAESFRTTLADELRAAFAARDHDAIRTLRCVMAAVDNAGALSQAASAQYAAASITEVPRRRLDQQEIAALLQAEIAARSRTVEIYARTGNTAHATQLAAEITTIERLATRLDASPAPK